MDKTKQGRILYFLLPLLLAVFTLLGGVRAFRLEEDPRQAVRQGVLLKLNDGWEQKSERQAEYVIPSQVGEGLMLSVRGVKQKFTLSLRDAGGQETIFYTYEPEVGPAEMRFFVALPDGAAGKTLLLKTDSEAVLGYMMRSEAVLGTQAKLTLHYFWCNLYALVFFLFCVIGAAGLCVLMVAMRKIFKPESWHQVSVMTGLLLDAGIWILTDSELLALASDRASFIAFCSLVSFGLTAPLTLEFVHCALKEESRSLRILQAVMLLILTADIMGWMLDGKEMFGLLLQLHLVIIAGMLFAFSLLLRSYRANKSGEVRDILMAFAVMAVSVLLSLAFFYGDHVGRQYAVCYCMGLMGFLLLLSRTVVHRITQAVNEYVQLENYKKLAYADSLTGLSNYTAFKYTKSRWTERTDWVYVVMDVNWLKQTNDKYGHKAGDDLLCCAARCIREAFYRTESCFRIGGDEFAAVGMTTDKAAVEAAVANLNHLCREWSGRKGYPVSVAVGYAMQNGRAMTVDELFAEADAAMYRNKTAMKKAVGDTVR